MPPAAIVLALSFVLYRLRVLGAGDGKTMALIAGYLGMDQGLYAIGAGLAVGAVWSVCLLLRKRDGRARLRHLYAWIRRMIFTKTLSSYEQLPGGGREDTVPLASCMAVGTGLYLLTVRLAETGWI